MLKICASLCGGTANIQGQTKPIIWAKDTQYIETNETCLCEAEQHDPITPCPMQTSQICACVCVCAFVCVCVCVCVPLS
jgi:hypothetical protein